MSTKLTVIGGGSSSFVPALIRGLIGSGPLGDAEVVLMDVNEQRVRTMEALAAKLIESSGSRLRVRSTTDRRASLIAADFVITTIAAGGMDAWEQDIEIPAKYGIVMHVADSIGPGGVMRALRNAPVIAAVARDVADVAPEALVFNYANPAAIELMALRSVPGVSSLSLCSCTAAPASARWVASQVGCEPDEIAMPVVVSGINHCASIVDLRLRDGRDGLPLARERAENPVVRWVLETYGVLPYCWEHWVEFHPQMQYQDAPYEGRAQGLPMRYGINVHNMDYERGRVRQFEDLAAEWTRPDAGPVTLEDLPPGDEDEGIEVIEIMEAIIDNRNETHVVNAVNHGTIPNLPPDAIVEVNAQVNRYGVRPIATGPLPEPLAAHLRRYVAFQQQTIKAALSGNRLDALHAFLLEPTIAARLDLDQTQALLDELLAAHAEFLPRFAATDHP
jgi:alpha-galactosidase/6-phospho-beta-glucosidase family protein